MVQPLAYLNGQFLPQAEAKIPLHDAGFIFGATATDLCRTFHHRLFRLSDHLARFRQSCALAHIPQLVPDADLKHLAEKLVVNNASLVKPEDDLALVMFATPGPIGYYAGLPGGPGDGPPTLGMHTFPLPLARYRSFFEHGVSLVVPDTRHVPANSFDPRAKIRSRLHWWLAEQEARDTQLSAVALLLDQEGRVTETAGANFLIVKGGTVVSPPRSSILNGISLQGVEELCRDNDIPFAETTLRVEECLAADEAMLASTPYCIAGVSRLNGQSIGWPGPVFRKLLSAWSERVGLDIAGQILAQR